MLIDLMPLFVNFIKDGKILIYTSEAKNSLIINQWLT